MTCHTSPTALTTGASLGDVLSWAEAVGESYDAICELKKIPARLGMIDDDIGLVPADLPHFDKVIAGSPYGVVSKSRNPEAAGRRADARVRALLGRFHAARGAVRVQAVPQSFEPLIAAVEAREGFVDRGAEFSTSAHRALFSLRARCRKPAPALDQAEIDRVHAEATTAKRRSIVKGIKLLNTLIRGHNGWPELAPHLPRTPFDLPKSADRAERILWDGLPEGFRRDAEAAFQETLSTPTDLAAWAKAQMAAGLSSAAINAAIGERIRKRGRRPKNSSSARAGYRGAVAWLVRLGKHEDGSHGALTTLRDLMSRRTIEAACEDQIARSNASILLKDPKESGTLAARLRNLRTLARHGLRDDEIVAHLDLMRIAYHEYVVTPKDLTDEADRICRRLRDHPHLAATFVHGPSRLADLATHAITEAKAREDVVAEEGALRLYAAAVAHAIQVSRPLRTSNLIRLRLAGTPELAGNVTWVKSRRHAELRFLRGEIKNERPVTVHILGGDAEILWTWIETHRLRFLELRGLAKSVYVFPGAASPRHVKDALVMPSGCMAPSTMAELWALGDERLGLGLNPHQCRHAIATLILAVEPGNFAKVASVLGDEEATVRRHYGRDSGEAAATKVRQALVGQHPDIFKRIKKMRAS